MLFTLATFLLPPLFVFGVYHLLTWFNVFRIKQRVFWKRLAITSAICHVLLASGFFVFAYLEPTDADYGTHLFNESNFSYLIKIYDTAAMLALLGLVTLLDRSSTNPPDLVALTLATTYVVGTLQWYFVGGGLGAILERFFEGLKTPDPEDDWEA